MKVLFLTFAFPKKNTPSLGTWAHQQAMAIMKLGISVEVVNLVPYVPKIAGLLSEKLKQYAEIQREERCGEIMVYHPKFFYKPGFMSGPILSRFIWLQLKYIVSQLEKRLDIREYHILHAHNLVPDGVVAWMLHQKYQIPYVITLHDIDKTTTIPNKGFEETVAKSILSSAKKVFAVSNRVKSSIAPYMNDPQRLQLLYNTFWTHGMIDGSLQEKKQKIVTIASLIHRKGIHILLEAFQKVQQAHPNYELIVIGNGGEFEDLNALARQLGIESRVTFTGAIEHGNAMKILSEAGIFCLPSWNEAFGVSYAEAMSLGIPVVGSQGEGIADIVTNQVDGVLVEPKNVDELQEALLFLIENPEAAMQIAQNGKERIKELRPDIFGEKLGRIYQEIIMAR